MGILSKIKNSLTGGWAEVSIIVGDAHRGEDLPFTVRCIVGKESIKIDRVYVKLVASEIVDIPNYKVYDNDDRSDRDYYHVKAKDELFESDRDVAGALELQAGETYEWEGSFAIPDHLPGTYNGRYAAVTCEMFAGLDMRGNDPDSGWQNIHIK